MNTIVKIAVFILAIIIVVILVNSFKTPQPESSQPVVTDQPPSVNDIPKPVTRAVRPSEQATTKRSKATNQPIDPRRTALSDRIRPSDAEVSRTPRPTLPDDLREKKEQLQQQLEEDQVQAERLYNMALFESKVAKKPMMTYKRMVDYCRQIITDYSGTSSAPKARQLLREMPERYRSQYNVTDEELGLNTEEQAK